MDCINQNLKLVFVVGYSELSKPHGIWIPERMKIAVSIDLKIFDNMYDSETF